MSRKRAQSTTCVLALLYVLMSPLAPAAANKGSDALVGIWTIDPAHSTYKGRPPLRGGTMRFARVARGTLVVCDVTTASGIPFHFEYQGPMDGTILKVTGNPYYDSESTTWTDPRTITRTEIRAGTVIGHTTMTVAVDGRSFMAVSERSAPEDGHLYTSTIVWKRSTG